MMLINKLYLNNFSNKEEAFIVQDSINLVLSFWVLNPDFLSLVIFSLQFL